MVYRSTVGVKNSYTGFNNIPMLEIPVIGEASSLQTFDFSTLQWVSHKKNLFQTKNRTITFCSIVKMLLVLKIASISSSFDILTFQIWQTSRRYIYLETEIMSHKLIYVFFSDNVAKERPEPYRDC